MGDRFSLITVRRFEFCPSSQEARRLRYSGAALGAHRLTFSAHHQDYRVLSCPRRSEAFRAVFANSCQQAARCDQKNLRLRDREFRGRYAPGR